ncbi:hypothetical protein LLG96_11585 [bacterium]|nr:hypothetical protein [bacterium]
MSVITLDSVVVGDILTDDIVVNKVTLFSAGTVVTRQILDILKTLKVPTLSVESRTIAGYDTLEATFGNIDERFSYVQDDPFMMTIKTWIKDILKESTPDRG